MLTDEHGEQMQVLGSLEGGLNEVSMQASCHRAILQKVSGTGQPLTIAVWSREEDPEKDETCFSGCHFLSQGEHCQMGNISLRDM